MQMIMFKHTYSPTFAEAAEAVSLPCPQLSDIDSRWLGPVVSLTESCVR